MVHAIHQDRRRAAKAHPFSLLRRFDKTAGHTQTSELTSERAQVIIRDAPVRTVIEVLQLDVHPSHARPIRAPGGTS